MIHKSIVIVKQVPMETAKTIACLIECMQYRSKIANGTSTNELLTEKETIIDSGEFDMLGGHWLIVVRSRGALY